MTPLEIAFKMEVKNFLEQEGIEFPDALIGIIVDKLINDCDYMWDTINSCIKDTIKEEFSNYL